MNITRQDVVDYARTWEGTPFRDQGRNKRGMDCLGYIWRIANDLQLCNEDLSTREVIDQFNYGRVANKGKFLAVLERYLVRIPMNEAQLADVYLYYYVHFPQHLALITDLGIIHSYQPLKGVREHNIKTTPPELRPVKAWRFPVFVEG